MNEMTDPQQKAGADLPYHEERITIPVISEELRVEKELVETGRVRVTKQVHEEIQSVAIPLDHTEFEVQRISVNRYVDAPPPVRHEGDTMVVPVLREEIVVQKRLVLVEEVHITQRRITTTDTQEVLLRREEVVVNRQPAQDAGEASNH